MSVHMKKPHTKSRKITYLSESGETYKIPLKVSESLSQYVVKDDIHINRIKAPFSKSPYALSENIFSNINKKYTKAGALLKAIRIRAGMNQKDFAKLFHIQQGDLSKMERGKRGIGKTIAQRIAKKFEIDYRLLL